MSTDESVREIQLNGKQLVFLFMAVTVVSVVIFLCGVLVGRGVRADRPAMAENSIAAIGADPIASPPRALSAPLPAPSTEAPAPAEELTYPERLQQNTTPIENLKSSAPAPSLFTTSPTPKKAASAARSSQPALVEIHRAATATTEPTGAGFAVQVAAYRDRREADTLVKRLVSKGYPAFVMAPVNGAPAAMYRVRVGKYVERREAEAVSHRLETEEQFKPWIAR